ncbi:subtilisin-like proteinase Mp1 [Melanomma pulvis-pyrius CBS 109.77]|uniref:Subtilisin-like proteinase Mp1 n=1 Tax=Melanomma pulvis-pyrius CBS 109.77 TaxID=1314802 RepID=A0A6A6XCZ7_9PLEO|nr:subtilisin-like proteinase Mp1 [Melanomma pulvis-pyrius CBS 109.77]
MATLQHALLFLASISPVISVPAENAPSKYIISLKSDATTDIESHLSWVTDVHRRSLSRRDTAGVERTFSIGSNFNAYTGEFDSETIAQIKENLNVAFVEVDVEQLVTTALVTQTDAPWGIASLSTPSLPNGNILGQKYVYDESAGGGTWAYVLDTGIFVNNTEFEGRAIKGYNAWPEDTFDDKYGHGSHVAGTIGSKTYGVAKKTTIVDVKVVRGTDGYSTIAKVLEGLDWIVKNITNTPGRAEKSVVSVSLAYAKSDVLNAGFEAAYAAGVLSVVGAANDNEDASTKSPASEPSVITVGAVDWQKTRAEWSNFGPLVDIFAPGVEIVSLWNKDDFPTTLSGTSMSTPHVSGLVLYLRGKESLLTPDDARDRLLALAQKGVVVNEGVGSPNFLAYHGAGA